MPIRNVYLKAPDGLVGENQQGKSEIIEKDTIDMVVCEWGGWMRENGTIDVIPSFESRRQSTASSFYESERSLMDMIENPESMSFDRIPEDDAPFELDEPIEPPFPFQLLSFQCDDGSKAIDSKDESTGNSCRPPQAYSALSATEERRLRDIAMPDYVLPGATEKEEQDNSDTEGFKAGGSPCGLKRKFTTAEEDQLDMFQYQKQSHNSVEKRYRTNLNDKINILRCNIPKFHNLPSKLTVRNEESKSPSACKSGKAAVLTGAVEYISQLENNTKRLAKEVAALKTRLAAFETLAIAGSIFTGVDVRTDMHMLELIEGNQADAQYLILIY